MTGVASKRRSHNERERALRDEKQQRAAGNNPTRRRLIIIIHRQFVYLLYVCCAGGCEYVDASTDPSARLILYTTLYIAFHETANQRRAGWLAEL